MSEAPPESPAPATQDLPWSRSYRNAVVVVFAVGIALRAIFYWADTDAFIGIDTDGYTVPAHDWLAGLPLDLFYRGPTYPVFLALFLPLFDYDYRGIVLLQHLLGLWGGFCLFRAYLNLFPTARFSALFLLAVFLVNPYLLHSEHLIQSEGLYTPLQLFLLFLFSLRPSRFDALKWTAAGLLAAALILCRATAQIYAVLLPLFLAWPAFRRRIPWRTAFRSAGLFLTPLLLILGGWSLRNQARHGIFGISAPDQTPILMFGSMSPYFDYESPLHASLKAKLKPFLTQGWEEVRRARATGQPFRELRYKGSNIFNWVYEHEPWPIVKEHAKLELSRVGKNPEYCDDYEIYTVAGRFIKDMSVEGIRKNPTAFLSEWWLPEMFQLYTHARGTDDSNPSVATWATARFFGNLKAQLASAPPAKSALLRRILENTPSPIERRSLRGDVKVAFLKLMRGSYYPPVIVGTLYWISFFVFLIKARPRPAEPAQGAVILLWAWVPFLYGAAIAALNDTILRYELPIDPLMWAFALAVWRDPIRRLLQAVGRDLRNITLSSPKAGLP